jgi:glutaredoxin
MIKVYGANWCGDTKRTCAYLDNLGIDYDYIDVESDASASEWVKSQNEEGKEKKPTLVVGSSVLVTPDESRLKSALEQEGLIDKS